MADTVASAAERRRHERGIGASARSTRVPLPSRRVKYGSKSMGLFRKKTSPAELAALSDEVSTMKARLDEADEVKAVLLAKLGAEQAERDARVASDSPDDDPAEPTEAERLGARLQAPPSSGSLEDVRTDVADLAERLSTFDARLNMLDERMTSISTELANQLTELSGELDVLLDQPTPSATGVDAEQLQSVVSDEVQQRLTEAVDDIEASTTRLASEQARYQIQFRQDLAELAERLRRPPTR